MRDTLQEVPMVLPRSEVASASHRSNTNDAPPLLPGTVAVERSRERPHLAAERVLELLVTDT
jgi:hypothetical protein